MVKNNLISKIAITVSIILFSLLAYKNFLVTCTSGGKVLLKVIITITIIVLILVIKLLPELFYRKHGYTVAESMGWNIPQAVKKFFKNKICCYVLLFLLSFTLRIAWVLIIKTPQYSDFQLFGWITDQIARNDPIYLSDPYFRMWGYQVGFPAFMSPVAMVFPSSMEALIFVNCLFESATILCIFYLASKCFYSGYAFAISCLYMLVPYPYMLVPVYTNQFTAAFFMYLGVCITFSKRSFSYKRCILGAFLIAFGNMLRPEGIIFLSAGIALLIILLFTKDSITNKLRFSKFAAVCFTSYIVSTMLISQFFILTNLNQYGLKNSFPLYKFAIGLNEVNKGQITAETANYLISIHNEHDSDTRDSIVTEIILEQISIGPKRLFTLFSDKIDVIWADKYRLYSALLPFKEEDFIPLFGELRIEVSDLKTIFAFSNNSCLLAIFLSCVASHCRAFMHKENSLLFMYLSLVSLATISIFFLVEVQWRYSFIVIPAIFMLAVGSSNKMDFENQ